MDRGAWWVAVHGVAKSQTQLSDFTFTFHFHALEKEMATHSSVLACRIPGTGEPGGLPSMGSHRVGHDWSDLASAAVLFLLSWGNRHLLLNMSPDHLFYFFNISFFRLFVHWEHWGIGDAEEAAFSLHRPWGPCWLFQPCPGSADPRVWLMAGGVCPELGLNIHRSLGSWFCWLCIGSSSRELYFYWLGSSDSWMWLHVAPVCWCVKLPLAC